MATPPTREQLEQTLGNIRLLQAHTIAAIDLMDEEDTKAADDQLAAAESSLELVASDFAEMRLKHI